MNTSRLIGTIAVCISAAAIGCASSGTQNAKTSSGEAGADATQGEASASNQAGQGASAASHKSAIASDDASELSAHLSVVDLQLAKSVSDRNPVSPGSEFTKASKVYAWVKLNVKAPETQVKFRWILDDKVRYTSDPVTVKQSPSWRSWRYKTVDEAGTWKVAILDADDKVIRSQSFKVN